MGKSGWSLAEATQLRRLGACVSSSAGTLCLSSLAGKTGVVARRSRPRTIGSGLCRIEIPLQGMAVIAVALLQQRGFRGKLRDALGKARLEHEGKRSLQLVRLQFGVAGRLEGVHVRPMGEHR